MQTSKSHDYDSARSDADVSQLIERGRAHFERREWNDAFSVLSAADDATPLGPENLDLLAWSAGLTARDKELVAALERLYRIYHESDERLRAARTCLLYTSPSPRDLSTSRMPSSA